MSSENPLSLGGRVALITGAASGLGLGTAKVLGRAGARVGVLDLPGESMDKAIAELRALGVECEPLAANVTDVASVEQACEALAKRFGTIDIVHANAGINGVWAPIEELRPEEFDETLAVNLRGSFLTIKFATPFLKRQGGSVVLTSSINGTRCFSNAGATAYSVSKAGQVAMAKMLAVELGRFGIRVNAICPGYIPSNIHQNTKVRNQKSIRVPVHYPEGAEPLKHQASPEQVGELVLFLVSDMARHITGEVVYFDAGTSLVVG